MAVNIYWAGDDAGTPLEQTYDHGDVANGANSAAQTIYLYHNASDDLNNCGLYLAQKSGIYTGDSSAAEDYQELLDWGDGVTATSFGGLCVNMDAAGTWADGWPVWNDKNPTYGFVCRTNIADTIDNAIDLSSRTGASSDGVLQANPPNGYGIGVAFQVRVTAPSEENVPGVRQFDLCLYYTQSS